jgi:hypothetical protein
MEKNNRLITVRLLRKDIEAADRIAAETGKTRNAVIVGALRNEAALRNQSQTEQNESTEKTND